VADQRHIGFGATRAFGVWQYFVAMGARGWDTEGGRGNQKQIAKQQREVTQMDVGYYFLAWFVVGWLVAMLVGRWFRIRGGVTAQGGREVQFYNAYGRLELLRAGNFFVLRCAACGQTFLQIRDRDHTDAAIALPEKALHHRCPWIKKQTHTASRRHAGRGL
jgi:hypothetical protein